MAEELQPWERRPDETDRAWEAWLVYRDMGPGRSVAEASRRLNISKTTINSWSTRHAWLERVKPFDRHMDRAALAEHAKEVGRLMGKQLALSEKLLDRLSENLDHLATGADPTMRWSTAYAAGTRAQREALSEVKPAAQKDLEEQADAMVDLAKFVARVTRRGRSDQSE